MEEEQQQHQQQRLAALALFKQSCSSSTDAYLSSWAWNMLPEEFRAEKEFILPVLQHAPVLPLSTDFEATFPQSIRQDRDVVLALLGRGREVSFGGGGLPDKNLTHDKAVMLAYCRNGGGSLQHCSRDLQDDAQMVETAILSRGGAELQYASWRLRQDKRLIQLACQTDGSALDFCPPGSVKQALLRDERFMLAVVSAANGGSMLRFVRAPSREMCLQAFLKGGLRWPQCPDKYKTDETLLLKVLEQKPEVYLQISTNNQRGRQLLSNRGLAMSAITSPSASTTTTTTIMSKVHARALRQFPDDQEIAFMVLPKEPRLFSDVSRRLQRDPQVIRAAIVSSNSAMNVMQRLSLPVLQAHPDILIQLIQRAPPHRLHELLRVVPPDSRLWSRRDVAIAWIRRRGRILQAFHDDLLTQDQVFGLEVAEHTHTQFHQISATLRGDLEFMKQAVSRNGRVLQYATPELRKNKALVVAAVANTVYALNGRIPVSLVELNRYCQEKLDLHTEFLKDICRGMDIAQAGEQSPLSMLQLGHETTQAFKEEIASDLGVPTGVELRLLRRARANLMPMVARYYEQRRR